MNKIIFSVFFLFLLSASTTQAQMTTPPETPNAEPSGIRLNVPIGETAEVSDFSQYVALWYGFVLGAVGIIAAVMIMWGGFKWLVSRGEPEAIRDAKERIIAAITGLVLAFLSYTILNLINPNLVNLTMPALTTTPSGSVSVSTPEASGGCCLFTFSNGRTGCSNADSADSCNQRQADSNGAITQASFSDKSQCKPAIPSCEAIETQQ